MNLLLNTTRGRINVGILTALVIAGTMVSGALAIAQSTSASSSAGSEITFPIPELGNCTDKASCKAYCDEAAHMEECIAFAKAHGFMSKEEVRHAEQFTKTMKTGSGPGACTSPKSCKAYCEDVDHMEECMAFAEKNGFKGKEYEQGQKVQKFLKQGGQMPGGCTSRMSCEAYCGDFSHAEECSAFAQKSGIGGGEEKRGGQMGRPSMTHEDAEGPMPTPEQMKLLGELAKQGSTPGACKTKNECETYCRDEAHIEECMAFGERVGFIKKEEAARMKEFRTKGGPGGCKSPDACHAYCNDSTHQEECFKFAEDNGFISKEEVAQTKEGWIRMREGITNAPKEVQECIQTTVGQSVIEDIQSGKLVPGPELGEKMRGCFEQFGGGHDPRDVFENMPAEVRTCLKEKLGDKFTAIEGGKAEPTPEIADTFRICFQQMEMTQGGMQGESGMHMKGEMGGERTNMMKGPSPEMLQGFLRSAPPEVSACLKEKLGAQLEQIQLGTTEPTPELGQYIRACFESFRPDPSSFGGTMEHREGGMPGKMPMPTGEMQGGQGEPYQVAPAQPSGMGMRMPPEVVACVKQKLSPEQVMQVSSGHPSPEVQMVMQACMKEFGGTMPIMPMSAPQPSSFPTQGMTAPAPTSGDFSSRMPGEVASCIKGKVGEEVFAKLGIERPTPEVGQVISACFAQFGATQQQMTAPAPTAYPLPPSPSGTALPPPPEYHPVEGTFDATKIEATEPPPPTTTTQSRTFSQRVIGAVAAPFVQIWGVFHD